MKILLLLLFSYPILDGQIKNRDICPIEVGIEDVAYCDNLHCPLCNLNVAWQIVGNNPIFK